MALSSVSSARPRWYLPVLVVILLFGMVLRVWLWQDQAIAGSVGAGDEDEYYRGAIHLYLQGDYYDTGKWLRPPVPSLYFAGAFTVLGVDLPVALLYQSALSLLAVALAATLTRRLFQNSDRRYATSAVAAAGVALYLPFAAYGSRILSETLFIVFLALSLVLLERAQARLRRGRSVAFLLLLSGIAIGLSILTRAFLFYYVPLLFLWLWWEDRRFRSAVVAFLWLVLGVAIVVAPWTIRNYFVYHQLVWVETEGGYSFLNGVDPGENEDRLQSYWIPAYPNSAERQRAQFALGIELVRRDPLKWIGRMRDKVTGLWHLHIRNLANNGTRGATLQLGSVNFALASDVEYVLLMLTAFGGLALARRDQLFWPLLALPVYTTLVGAATVTSVRIREPLTLALIVYAAPVLADPRGALGALFHAPRWRQAFAVAATLVFILVIYSSAYINFIQGRFWLAVSQFGGGESAIQRAISADRDSVFPYLALGNYDLAHNRPDAALKAYEQAHAQMKDNTEVQARLVQALRQQGDVAGAQAAAQAIADVGFDNSQWYEWAWTRVPYWPSGAVDPGAPAVGVMRGVYPVSQDAGVFYRWTLDRADFRVSQPGATQLALRLFADQPKPVQIWIDGQYLQTVTVTPAFSTYTLPLLHPASAQSLIELRSPATVTNVDSPYSRGVAVFQLALTPR
ncbi:MAG: glycosyltransferase family 39 protein [Anaerolineae bacterium]